MPPFSTFGLKQIDASSLVNGQNYTVESLRANNHFYGTFRGSVDGYLMFKIIQEFEGGNWFPYRQESEDDDGYHVIEDRNINNYIFYTQDKTIETKAKVQAVKDVLAKRGVAETSDVGPLSTVLSMAGIKPPPKQSGVGRRKKTNRKHKSRKTKRRV